MYMVTKLHETVIEQPKPPADESNNFQVRSWERESDKYDKRVSEYEKNAPYIN